MARLPRNHPFIWHLILILLLLTGCSAPAPMAVQAAKTQPAAATASPRPAEPLPPTETLTPTRPQPTPTSTPAATATATAAATQTPIPPTETPAPPVLEFLTDIATLPAGHYLVYWSFRDPFCGLKAVSTDQKVYPLINFGCHASPGSGSIVLADDGLALLMAQGNSGYVYYPLAHRYARLTPSQRSDCTITALSRDGTRLAGRCGGPDFGTPARLAVRTLEQDWQELKPFSPDDSNKVLFTTAWSPDGKKLAYVNEDYHHQGVFVINDVDACLADTSRCLEQVSGPYWQKTTDYLAWSPDGKQIAVTLSQATLVYDLTTKQSRTVVDYGPQNLWLHGAAWSPDGKWIGYFRDYEPNNMTDMNLYMTSLSDGTTYFLAGRDGGMVVAWLDIKQ